MEVIHILYSSLASTHSSWGIHADPEKTTLLWEREYGFCNRRVEMVIWVLCYLSFFKSCLFIQTINMLTHFYLARGNSLTLPWVQVSTKLSASQDSPPRLTVLQSCQDSRTLSPGKWDLHCYGTVPVNPLIWWCHQWDPSRKKYMPYSQLYLLC